MKETERDLKSIRPMRGRAIVEILKEMVTTGGIVLLEDMTENAKKTCHKARVISVGTSEMDEKGRTVHMPEIAPGDLVLTRHIGPAMRGKSRPCTNPQNPDAECVLSIPGDWIMAVLESAA